MVKVREVKHSDSELSDLTSEVDEEESPVPSGQDQSKESGSEDQYDDESDDENDFLMIGSQDESGEGEEMGEDELMFDDYA